MKPIIIRLKQHTPILHFQYQWASEGATLRATELKPKLDRYLLANYTIPQEWKIGDTQALDYKLNIAVRGKSRVNNGEAPMYFGKKDEKKLVECISEKDKHDVTVEVVCLIDGLRKYLNDENVWRKFLLVNNFGTRQSKGYGSFSLFVDSNPAPEVGTEIKALDGTTYRVDSFFPAQVSSWREVMDQISDVYKCLRSGINENKLYFKSLMFAYAKNNGQWWDKRTIKELFAIQKLDEHRRRHPNRKEPDPLAVNPQVAKGKECYPMFRDNLGLSTSEQWKDYGFRSIKRNNKEIMRFKSPLLFKPMRVDGKWQVFLLHREIPLKFKNATFSVNNKINMKTFDGFSMKNYLNYVFGTIGDYGLYASAGNEDAQNRKNRIINTLKNIKNNFKKIE